MIDFPPEFLRSMQEQLQSAYPDFLRAICSGGSSSRAFRINTLKPSAMEIAERYAESPVPWAPSGRYARPDTRPGATLAHFSGALYVQEASAMCAVQALDPKPGEYVLDLCAAPGGKSGQIAERLRGQGLLVSNEPMPERAKTLSGNLERLGVTNAVVTNAYPDALARALPALFDAVLVDAPCSGEGMFARDEDTRAEWFPSLPEACANRQAQILDAAVEMIRPGGRLVYSTCTFNETENEQTIRAFLARHPDFQPEDFALNGVGSSQGGMLRLWPHLVRGDGHFVSRFRKSEGTVKARVSKGRASKQAESDLQEIRRLALRRLPKHLQTEHLTYVGDHLYAAPMDLTPLKDIRVLRPGLCLLRRGKSHIEPDHALAMALCPEDALRVNELTLDDAIRWCAGEALPSDGEPGWTLVTHNGLPLGWGKISSGLLKNHLPKGLRRKFYKENEEGSA